jgi:hypothetical protein
MAGLGLVIQVAADTADAVRGIHGVEKALEGQMTTADRWGARLDAASRVAAAGLLAVGAAAGLSLKMAVDDAASQATLAQSLRNTTGATAASVAATEAWISAQGAALGVADDQLRPALASLATATGDVAEAQELAALAMDVAAARGVDVATAADAMAKAYAGNTGALGKMIPGIDKAVLASGDFAAIQAEVARVVGGQATTAADTAAGRYARLQLIMSETAETIGAALLPVLEQLLPPLMDAAEWASNNTGIVLALVAAFSALAAAVVITNAVLKIYAAYQAIAVGLAAAWRVAMAAMIVTQYALNLAMTLNPIGLVVAALALMVAGLVIAYQRSETFRDIVDGVWESIKKAVDWIGRLIAKIKEIVWPKAPSWFGGGGSSAASAAAYSRAAPASTGTTATAPTIVIQAGVGDPHEIARAVRRILRDDAARLGRPAVAGAW